MVYSRERNMHRQFQDLYGAMYPDELNNVSISGTLVKNITFVVTENCTLRCSYCYECNKDYSVVMSEDVAFKAIDALLDRSKINNYINADETKAVILEFIGGEPLLEIELIDKIVDYFRYKCEILNHPWKNQYMISMTSNGTEYFNPKVQEFIKKNASRLSLTITIDGNKALHDACRVFPSGEGSYDIVEKAVIHAHENYGLKTSKITLAPDNIGFITEAVINLISLGLTDINANCVFEDVWDNNIHPQIFYKELIKLADYFIDNKIYDYAYCSIFDENIGGLVDDDRNWCGGNGSMLAIGTDGRMFPCIRFMKYSLKNERPEFVIGNIEDGIDNEEDNAYLKQLKCITRTSQSPKECLECPVASGCAWCTGYNYDVFGTPNKRATFICYMHKARVLANYYYWNKLYKQEGIDTVFSLNLSERDIKFIKGDIND